MACGMLNQNDKKSEFESPYKRYKISTTVKPIGLDL